MRPGAPTGTVTFVFTDIEGSTRLLEELGTERYGELLAHHHRVCRLAWAEHGGVEVDTAGDAFFVVFESASAALAAVGEAQDGLGELGLRVRMGVHTGEVAVNETGYLGFEVHRAARIAASAHGGQVVVSDTTALAAGRDGLVELGEHRFKDLDEPVRIFQLGEGSFPPLKTLSNTNLPRPASSFVGREHELAEVLGRFEHGARLITLTGPGGSGKTRLALEAAATLVPEFKAGVFWVGVATLRDPALVTESIAQTLGAKDGVAGHIGERELLLLLDNLEQVIDSAPELSALLRACPNLRLLVTSRELLRIDGEVEYSVPPLAEAEAVALFCERAQTAASDDIRELCVRLDNLPLAVELAAARTNALAPAQILERLSKRLDLLKGGRDADPRQQTLRATIDWSYELLTDDEQRLYAHLGVFRGGCTLEAVEEVCDADLDALESLLDKSLLRVRDTNSARRYWMLETIREHAAERLDESADADAIRRSLARWILDLARRGGDAAWGPEHDVWAERIEAEHPNLLEAFHWLLGTDPDAAARLVADAARASWDGGARSREGLSLLALALDQPDAVAARARADVLFAIGRLAYVEDDRVTERQAFQECIELARRLGDATLEALACIELGWTAMVDDHLDEAHALADVGSAAAAAIGDGQLRQRALQLQAVLAGERGDLDTASSLHDEALSVARSIGNRRAAAGEVASLGWVALLREDYDAAFSYSLQALAGMTPAEAENRAVAHGNVGLAALLRDDDDTALDHFGRCLELCGELGMVRFAAEALTGVSAHAAKHGKTERALHLLAASDALHEQSTSAPSVVEDRLRARFHSAAHPGNSERWTLEEAVAYALSGLSEQRT